MIKIEKYVPIPSARSGSTNISLDEIRKTISQLAIGDSFIVPKEFLTAKHTSGNLWVGRNLYNLFKRAGKKCAIRTVDRDKNIFRCWRTE